MKRPKVRYRAKQPFDPMLDDRIEVWNETGYWFVLPRRVGKDAAMIARALNLYAAVKRGELRVVEGEKK